MTTTNTLYPALRARIEGDLREERNRAAHATDEATDEPQISLAVFYGIEKFDELRGNGWPIIEAVNGSRVAAIAFDKHQWE